MHKPGRCNPTVDGNAEAEFDADDDVVGAEFNDDVKSFGDMDVTGNVLLDASTAATSVRRTLM